MLFSNFWILIYKQNITKMQKTILVTVFVLLALQAQTQILKINNLSTTEVINPNILPILTRTNTAEVYYGKVQIKVPGQDVTKIEFYVSLVRNDTNCAYARCYNGWVNNYTQDGTTIVGFGNQTLEIQPVFQFKTNSEKDFIIIRNPRLAEVWVQIIQIICQKINPQIASKTSSTSQKIVAGESLISQFTTTPPESDAIIPKYSFQTISSADLLQASTLKSTNLIYGTQTYDITRLGLVAGDRVAKLSEPLLLSGFKAPTSSLSQSLVLNSQNVVKKRLITYDVKLTTDLQPTSTGEKAPDFSGLVDLQFNLIGKVQVPTTNSASVYNLLADATNRKLYDSQIIQQRRTVGPSVFANVQRIAQISTTPEDAEILVGLNQVPLKFNIVDQLNQVTTSTVSQVQTIKIDSFSLRGSTRLLQVLQNYTIYNYKKVLFSKTIFGKTFETNVEVKCYLLVYSNDHKLQCTGTFNYALFGKSKSVQVFNWVKSIHIAWNYYKQFSGTWPFSIYIPLPAPVSFLGINFQFSISYKITIDIKVTTTGADPLVYKCATVATTQVDTTASAALRAIAIEGGVYIQGTLVRVKTDPTVSLSYYIKQKYIKVLAQWYFQIQAFNFEWGFFYRYWTFWSGWSSKKIIAKWTINGVYGKWAIVNKTWYIYL